MPKINFHHKKLCILNVALIAIMSIASIAQEHQQPINARTIRLGVYGIITHKDEVLMTRTQSGSKLIYNFPGGGVDEEESLAQAL